MIRKVIIFVRVIKMLLTVGQFNDSYLPIMDGVVNVVNNYAYWINKKYGKSYVVAPKFPKYKDFNEFEVIRYTSTFLPCRPPYRLGIPQLAYSSKRKLSQIDFNILHTHSPFSTGHLALKLARKKNIPIVATFHTKFYDDFKPILKSDYLTNIVMKRIIAFFDKVDYVWTVNESTAETLKSYGYKKNIDIIQNGTDFSTDFDYDENKKYMKQIYDINDNDLMFLFVGQHIWQKNLKLLTDALYLVKQINIPFKMFFIGEGYAKKDLISLVKKYNLSEQTYFMGKITDRELLKRFFARSDLFLFPSVYDNAPIVIREAAALKTPSLVIENSNAQEGIIDRVNGYTCKENPQSLAEKIKLITADKSTLMLVGKKAQETICRSWETIIDEVGLKYQEIILRHSRK